MVHIVIVACFVGEDVAVPRTVFAYDAAMDDGTVLVFRPRPHGRVGSGIAHGIVNAPVVVGRVKEIVHAVQFDDGGAFHYGGGDVGGGCFPFFGALHALLQGAGNDFTFGEVELCYPYKVSVTEAHVVQVILAVIIAEQEGVDILLASVYRLYICLAERAFPRVGRCHYGLFVGGNGLAL